MNGTPLPIVLNLSVNDIFGGKEKFFGKDCSASASATVKRLALYGCKCTSLFP